MISLKNKKAPLSPIEKTGAINIALPLCFALTSRQEPPRVPSHHSAITCAHGKIYSVGLWILQLTGWIRKASLLSCTYRQLSAREVILLRFLLRRLWISEIWKHSITAITVCQVNFWILIHFLFIFMQDIQIISAHYMQHSHSKPLIVSSLYWPRGKNMLKSIERRNIRLIQAQYY